MKLLHLTSSTGYYGAERMVIELGEGLMRRGCDVTLMNLRGAAFHGVSMIERARMLHIPAEEIDCHGRFDGSALRAIRRYVRDRGIDIIHSHGYKADMYALLARAPRTSGLMATCHNWPSSSMLMRCYRALDKAVLRAFTRVTVVSEALRRELERSGVPGERIATVHNGIDIGQRPAGVPADVMRRTLGIGAGEKVITAVGRLSPEKGYDCLIAAASEVCAAAPEARFLVAGSGPEEAALLRRIGAAGLDGRFTLLGRREDVADILAVTDIFVMSSITEGMPMALLEAMAAGKAVVATSVGEMPEMIEDGLSGLLVGPRDVRALAEAVVALLRDRPRAALLGAAARQRAVSAFSVEEMAARYMRMYEDICAAGRQGETDAG